MINGSDHQAILRLSNLVKGIYQFRLTVRDGKGKESHDDAKIYVKEGEVTYLPFHVNFSQ